ncbi:MAG: hypothetical protein DI613_06480 [Kocuria rhizophila]|nr:MAG: hypothetical protein DI613_06480 [Kocuria rhizophila]
MSSVSDGGSVGETQPGQVGTSSLQQARLLFRLVLDCLHHGRRRRSCRQLGGARGIGECHRGGHLVSVIEFSPSRVGGEDGDLGGLQIVADPFRA